MFRPLLITTKLMLMLTFLLAMALDPLLTLPDVMKCLQISENSVLRLASSGRLRGVKVLGRWRFRPSDIEAFLNADDDNA
jgi:excisionase family DNA binding protein